MWARKLLYGTNRFLQSPDTEIEDLVPESSDGVMCYIALGGGIR
jgi:hypothetical protein